MYMRCILKGGESEAAKGKGREVRGKEESLVEVNLTLASGIESLLRRVPPDVLFAHLLELDSFGSHTRGPTRSEPHSSLKYDRYFDWLGGLEAAGVWAS